MFLVKSGGRQGADTLGAYKSEGGFFHFAKGLRPPFLWNRALERVEVSPAHATVEVSGGTYFVHDFDDAVAASTHIIVVPERAFSIEIDLRGARDTRQPERD